MTRGVFGGDDVLAAKISEKKRERRGREEGRGCAFILNFILGWQDFTNLVCPLCCLRQAHLPSVDSKPQQLGNVQDTGAGYLGL